MFDLEREVAAWSEAVHAGPCRRAGSVAELSDHLYCEIERARAEGLSDERAFAAAVAKLGNGTELAAEHAKNRSLLATGCAVAARWDKVPAARGSRKLLLAHAFVWAALTLSSALILKKYGAREAFTWLWLVVLLPSWLASEQILRRALQPKPAARA